MPVTRAEKCGERDIVFDIDYAWGDATTAPSVMDLQNILLLCDSVHFADSFVGASRENWLVGAFCSDESLPRKKSTSSPKNVGFTA